MKDDELYIISIVNFIRGGKSSLARLLAEHHKTYVLNFDPHRNAENYNVVPTKNIPQNTTIKRNKEGLLITENNEDFQITINSDYLICDFGGRFDERINEFKSNCYIVPTCDDYESITETIKAIKFILKANKKAKIIPVLNLQNSPNGKKKKDAIEFFKDTLKVNKLGDLKIVYMPKSSLFESLVNNGKKKSELVDSLDRPKRYPNVNKLISDLEEQISA